jgi:hypothetical protein
MLAPLGEGGRRADVDRAGARSTRRREARSAGAGRLRPVSSRKTIFVLCLLLCYCCANPCNALVCVMAAKLRKSLQCDSGLCIALAAALKQKTSKIASNRVGQDRQ